MNPTDLFSTPEFQNLHPVKKMMIEEIVRGSRDNSPEAMLSKMMTVNRELSKRNLNFTKEESALLIRIIKQTLSPAERQKADLLLNMFSH